MISGIHLVTQPERFVTTNPATGEILASYPSAGESEVRAAVSRARQAQQWWSRLPLLRRTALLRRVAQMLVAEKEELARIITSESGKPLQEALLTDVLVAADCALYCAEEAASVLRSIEIDHANPALRFKRGRIQWEPLGVIGILSPWNYPLSIPAADVFAALAVGNAVVLKPSELTPQTALELERLICRALDAEGLRSEPRPLQVITGLGPSGQHLVASAIDKLIFTGSVATGKVVAVAAGARLLPVVLELGGKDAMIVLADADLDTASSAAVWGAMMNAGQTCISVERCYVHQAVCDRFLSLCRQKIDRLRVGNGLDAATDVGPLVSSRQLRAVSAQVEEARELGAVVHTGGCVLPELGENFYAPTLITGVAPEASLMREETFGPVLPVASFTSDAEAIALANSGSFGLAASVWGGTAHAERVAQRIEAGSVLVNDLLTNFAVPSSPHGGLRDSGVGRTHGRVGLLEMVRPRTIDVDRLPRMKKLWWYPYEGNFRAMSAFAGVVHGPGVWTRLKSALRSLPLMLSRRH